MFLAVLNMWLLTSVCEDKSSLGLVVPLTIYDEFKLTYICGL